MVSHTDHRMWTWVNRNSSIGWRDFPLTAVWFLTLPKKVSYSCLWHFSITKPKNPLAISLKMVQFYLFFIPCLLKTYDQLYLWTSSLPEWSPSRACPTTFVRSTAILSGIDWWDGVWYLQKWLLFNSRACYSWPWHFSVTFSVMSLSLLFPHLWEKWGIPVFHACEHLNSFQLVDQPKEAHLPYITDEISSHLSYRF